MVGPGSMIRGKALSAATTYHLSLVYGIGFIIYIKEFLSQKISLTNVFIGLLIFVGIFLQEEQVLLEWQSACLLL